MAEVPLSSANLYMNFPEIWRLGEGPNPRLLAEYLTWVVSDGERFLSAAASMQWLPVGFNALTIARATNKESIVKKSLQLNFYNENFPGNEHPHGHSRDAQTIWYALPEARQQITRHVPLGHAALKYAQLPVVERLVVPNSIVDYRDGRRPGYHPAVVGSCLVMVLSETKVAPLGSQKFSNLEVHHVGFIGQGTAISVHLKEQEEPEALTTQRGLRGYKNLTSKQAEVVAAIRQSLRETLDQCDNKRGPRLGPTTMLYPPLDFTLTDMEPEPTPTPQIVAESLILSGLRTVSVLVKALV